MNFFKNAAVVLFPITLAAITIMLVVKGSAKLVGTIKKHKKNHR